MNYSHEGRLTPAGQVMLSQWLQEWPNPEMLLRRWNPGLLTAVQLRVGKEDTTAWANLAVVKGLLSYRAASGGFTGYAKRCVLNQMLTLLRRTPDPVYADSVETAGVLGHHDLDDRDELDTALGLCDPRGAVILRERYGVPDGRPKTYKEVGVKVRLTSERVRQIEFQTFQQLADHYGRPK